MFDPIAYLMGAAAGGGGGGGGASLILDYKYTQPGGGPAYEYDRTITIQDAGSYLILATGYVSSLTVYINGTKDPNYFEKDIEYSYMYNAEKTLKAGDTVRISIASSGLTGVSIAIIKTA